MIFDSIIGLESESGKRALLSCLSVADGGASSSYALTPGIQGGFLSMRINYVVEPCRKEVREHEHKAVSCWGMIWSNSPAAPGKLDEGHVRSFVSSASLRFSL
jgi:hypothetical protein